MIDHIGHVHKLRFGQEDVLDFVPGRKEGKGYPDIVDLATREFYEIKAVKEFQTGVKDVLDYIAGITDHGDMNLYPGVLWPFLAPRVQRSEPWFGGRMLTCWHSVLLDGVALPHCNHRVHD